MTTQVQGTAVTRRFRTARQALYWQRYEEFKGGWVIGLGYDHGLIGGMRGRILGRYIVSMITP